MIPSSNVQIKAQSPHSRFDAGQQEFRGNIATRISALIGASHELQGRLDAPPCRALFVVSLFGKRSRFIGGYHNCFVAVPFQQLLGIFADLDFLDGRSPVHEKS
jgi:hypothetical protein